MQPLKTFPISSSTSCVSSTRFSPPVPLPPSCRRLSTSTTSTSSVSSTPTTLPFSSLSPPLLTRRSPFSSSARTAPSSSPRAPPLPNGPLRSASCPAPATRRSTATSSSAACHTTPLAATSSTARTPRCCRAWARLSPHTQEQQLVLPNRMNLAPTIADTVAVAFPTRLHRR